jgi:putative ABC transport system permease protein
MIERVLQDLRLARRSLARNPVYVAIAAGTLALGIGITTALFTVVNGVLLRPLAFPEPDRLVMVWERPPDSLRNNVVQTQNFLDWHSRNQSFLGIAALHQLPTNLTGSGEAEQVQGLRVTGDFFSVLGVAPLLGRTIRPGEDRPGVPRTAVLSYALWRQRYGGDPNVIGRKIVINGTPAEIVGVMPGSFGFPGVRAELFVPLQIDPRTAPFDGRNFSTVARLRPGVTVEAARAEMQAIAAATARERPQMNERWSANVVTLAEQAVGQVRRPLLILLVAVACVMLVACVNVMNLTLMRVVSNARDISVRLALGASRGRLIHQLVVESLIVSGIGGLLGLLLARAGVPGILSLFPASFPLPRAAEVTMDGRVLAFTALLTIGTAVAFAVAPGFVAGRSPLAESLHAGGRSIAGSGRRMRSLLTAIEIAMAVVLVVGAGLTARSLMRLYAVDPGFRSERLLAVRMLLVPARYLDPIRRAGFVDSVLERLRALPGVQSASSIHALPLTGIGSGTYYYRADRPTPSPGERPGGDVSVVSTAYFGTMEIPVIRGRDFDRRDGFNAPFVAVINRTLAREFFGDEDPLGKRLVVGWGTAGRSMTDDPTVEIVGIVGDVHHSGLQEKPAATVYLPHDQWPNFLAVLVIRTTGDPEAIAASVRGVVHGIDPDQGILQTDTVAQVIADSVARPRLQAVLMGSFGVLALILACGGLYGIISYSVEQRRREMGVRLALGAGRSGVLRLVMTEGLRLTAIGMTIGFLLALVLARSLEALLFEVTPTDPPVFVAVGAALLLTAAAASSVPAWRATRVDPAVVLRNE